ncbi:MAG: acyl-CoA dehydratase activase [Actinomycetota bacterium]|nr:acyl-CoA dehydratase activase [Actinomycetota bacterium]
MELYIGYDIGSVSVNRAVLDRRHQAIDVLEYTRHQGEPLKVIRKDLSQLLEKYEGDSIRGLAFTGSGGKGVATALKAVFINEIEALMNACRQYMPDASTVIDIGGQDSKYIDLAIGDYAMNELCAAGTGSFLDQQASRFGLSIEEFAQVALKSDNPETIAGRCSVFAKSDMIHLQQEAARDEDIMLGLCYAMARSFKSGIVKGKKFKPPVVFCGGVSNNQAMAAAFKDVLGLPITVPDHNESLGAIGAALSAMSGGKPADRESLRLLDDYIAGLKYERDTFEPLSIQKSELPAYTAEEYEFGTGKVDAYIGIDVGSISTNVVAIDRHKRLIAKCYLRTAGRPIEAVRKGIAIIGQEVGDKITVKGAGTTGSGRYLIGDFVGSDIVINEITAQATAAAAIDKEVDTIFEIGGQDSKYISLENGVVVDFEMNKVCAAGTGSFLEEQSERFNLAIEEFAPIALKAQNPLDLGERCTVFMETNVYSHYQKGAQVDNILAGLAYSIVMNYINRVVARKKIGNKIFFQGAVAFNHAVVAAFEKYLDTKIIVPPHHEVTGAIGTAIAALEHGGDATNFRGFGPISEVSYQQKSFECKGCANHCDIKMVSIEGEKPLYYGGRCEKYEQSNKAKNDIPDYFQDREDILLGTYKPQQRKGAKRVGIPFTMLTYEFYPFWGAYFDNLGLEVVLSDKTNKQIIASGLSSVIAETCFPMKAMLGHIHNLLDKGIDYLFVPTIRDMPAKHHAIKGDRTGSYPCPFVQGIPSIVKAAIDLDGVEVLDPIINFSFEGYAKSRQLQQLGQKIGGGKAAINKAIQAAYQAQNQFYSKLRQRGNEVLADLGPDEPAIVVTSRSYNSCDRSISMDIPNKLRDCGMKVIPLDFLPLETVDLSQQWPNLYWEFGDRIISAAKIIREDARLYPAYLTNFGCGPDSFILQYFEREMDKPFLKIEIDEHTGGAGVVTRCEAFIDSLKNYRKTAHTPGPEPYLAPVSFKKGDRRTLYIPYMSDGSYAIQAAFKSVGIDSEVMISDDETLELGRRHTLGKECYPFIITTGDILKTLKYNDPGRCAFLMPLTYGPCRFGQYNQLQKIIIAEQGYEGVPIVSPGAPESSRFYEEYDMDNIRGLRLLGRAMQGVFTMDNLDKMARKVRPYEKQAGQASSLYDKYLKQIIGLLETQPHKALFGQLVDLLARARQEFEAVEVEKAKKPLIGVVGEIYVRNHPYSNNEIVKKVEQLGGEVDIPTISEWPSHTTATSKLDNSVKQADLWYKILGAAGFNSIIGRTNGGLGSLVSDYVKTIRFYALNRLNNRIIASYLSKLAKPVEGFVRDTDNHDIYHTWDAAEPYIIKWFGEAALSVGKSVNWIEQGFDGIINVMPFTCMPGTIVTATSKRIREKYKVPWLNLAFDGLEQGTTETRLEAFMYQARLYAEQKDGK